MAQLALTTLAMLMPIVIHCAVKVTHVLQSWKWLLKGRSMMSAHAHSSPHLPLALSIPGNRLHVLYTKQHWADINGAPISQLSPNAASREMFQPKYSFGFDWGAPREQVSSATVRSIKNMTAQLPMLQERYAAILDDEFRKTIASCPSKGDWTPVPMWATIQRAVTRVNTSLFLGEEIANNEEFTDRGLKFVSQVTLVLEAVRLVPSALAPLVTKLIKGRNNEQKFVFSTLARLINERIDYNASTPESTKTKAKTFVQGFVDHQPDDFTTANCVDAINTTWVVSTLAIPIVACQLIQDMCIQKQHTQHLRSEAGTVPLGVSGASEQVFRQIEKLELLEAFSMESMRTKCFQSNTCHRIALQAIHFTDGHKVSAGEAVEFNQQSVLQDPATYPDPSSFDPSRFLREGRTMVDTGVDWPFWGVPRLICPGRWHVASTMKLLAVYLLSNFDFKIEDERNLNFEWRDALVPNPKTVLLMKPLKKS